MKTYYRQNLPHLIPVGATFFITFRLANALPYAFLYRLKQQFETDLEKIIQSKPRDIEAETYALHLKHFERYDEALHQVRSGETYLAQKEIAQLVADKLHEFDGLWYNLLAYCIMPNHVHLIIDTSIQVHGLDIDQEVNAENYKQVFQIMHHIKGASSHGANQLLGLTGPFWQKESYDHYVRNEKELTNFITYTIENPVKAGLVKQWSFKHTTQTFTI